MYMTEIDAPVQANITDAIPPPPKTKLFKKHYIVITIVIFLLILIILIIGILTFPKLILNTSINQSDVLPTQQPTSPSIVPNKSITASVVSQTFIAPIQQSYQISKLVVNPDGTQMAYANNTSELLINGEVVNKGFTQYDYPIYSPDGNLGFMGKKNGAWYFSLSEKEIGPYEWASFPTISMDAKHYAFVALKNGKWIIVKDGKEIDGYGTALYQLTLSQDGSHYTYVGKENNKEFLVVDGVKGKLYDYIISPTLNYNGTQIAYTARLGSTQYPIVNGIEKTPEELSCFTSDIYSYTFNKKGELAYICGLENGRTSTSVILNDEQIGKAFPHISHVTFSPDGKHLAFATYESTYTDGQGSKTEGIVVLDGKEVWRGPISGFDIFYLNFSSDGKSIIIITPENNMWKRTVLRLT